MTYYQQPSSSQTKPVARGYCRVSTIMQSEQGVSLETQKRRITDHCLYKNLDLVNIYVDSGLSGKNMQRPGLKEVLNDVQSGDYVIVSDLSRLSRSTKDALEMFEKFKERGAKFVCLQPDIDFSTPVGELMFTVLMAVHRLERQNISMHVSNNMKRLAKEGKLRSRPPFGFKFVGKDKDFEPEPEQQEVIEKVKKMYIEGKKYAPIARALNDAGDNKCLNNNKKNPRNENPKFYAETIKNILIDAGLVGPKNCNRLPIDKRIICHHKSNTDNTD